MPKLSKAKAKAVAANEGGTFTLLPDGKARVKLVEVKVSDKPGPSGDDYWSWEMAIVPDADLDYDEYTGRKLWYTTSLGESSEWAMKGAFDAFGFTADSDTDEMLGEECFAIIGHRVIDRGARKGQEANNVEQLLPVDGSADDDGDDDDLI